MHSLLLIDDDPELCALLKDYLTPEGFSLHFVRGGLEGLAILASGTFDMVILDVGLPDTNGFDVLGEIRSRSQIPVIMLTGRAEDVDRIVGLEMGADDYLPKPFVPRELLARIRSILRRSRMTKSLVSPRSRQVFIDDLQVDRGARTVHRNTEPVVLTFAEYTILEMLLEGNGSTVSREDISVKALGRELAAYDRSIDVHMSNLRKKLGPAPNGGERIVTVRGAGYFFNCTESSDLQPVENSGAFFRISGGMQ